eukprot:COSAG01_NODE_1658_length_9590_cov_6.038984_2_plen_50_part_00
MTEANNAYSVRPRIKSQRNHTRHGYPGWLGHSQSLHEIFAGLIPPRGLF